MHRSALARFSKLYVVLVGVLTCIWVVPAWGTEKNARYIPYVGTDGRTGYVDLLQPGKHALPHVSPTVRRKSADGITFNLYFNDVIDKTGIGFDDPVTGADARACVSDVCDYLNTVLVEHGVCDVLLQDSFDDGSSPVLAATLTYLLPSSQFDNGFAFHHITTGTSPQPVITGFLAAASFLQCLPGSTVTAPDGTEQIADMSVGINVGYKWNFGKAPPTDDEFDLRAVLLHEFTHALGFASSVGSDGQPAFLYGMFKFLDFIETGNGKKLWDSQTTAFLGDPTDLLGQDNGVVFAGAAVVQAFGKTPPVYAPPYWEMGSSLDHWDIIPLNNTVMKWGTVKGDMMRAYAPIDIAALHDLGYNTVGAADWGTAPVAAFTATPVVGSAPLSVVFQDASVAGAEPIASWFWSFGDGNSSEDQNPTHVYDTAGTYEVKLLVRSATRGDIADKTDCITVFEAQNAAVLDLLPILVGFALFGKYGKYGKNGKNETREEMRQSD